jgi:hypothetical protein
MTLKHWCRMRFFFSFFYFGSQVDTDARGIYRPWVNIYNVNETAVMSLPTIQYPWKAHRTQKTSMNGSASMPTTVDSEILKNWRAGIHQRLCSVLRWLLGLTVDGAQVPIGKIEKIKKVWRAGVRPDARARKPETDYFFLSLIDELELLKGTEIGFTCNERNRI